MTPRAAYEASGFVVRRVIDAARVAHRHRRRSGSSLSGGGTLVDAVGAGRGRRDRAAGRLRRGPEGAALGSAWLARMAAGLEEPTAMTDGRVGARRSGGGARRATGWSRCGERYERFLACRPRRSGTR